MKINLENAGKSLNTEQSSSKICSNALPPQPQPRIIWFNLSTNQKELPLKLILPGLISYGEKKRGIKKIKMFQNVI